MITRHAGRNIRTDSLSPPLQRAKKVLEMRIHRRFHGSHVTFLEGQPGRHRRKGAKETPRRKGAISEREAIRLDWMRRTRPKPHRRYEIDLQDNENDNAVRNEVGRKHGLYLHIQVSTVIGTHGTGQKKCTGV
ncbi:hypothetical protein PCH_Pc22g27080 [Penicillium rubens Wisconsin 54-1255]|uniref:Uncharacterized protein n=1 Tax=Penicillium rubens (strain ATCC 28089 / DSM 1075 / NRRL 1951 / Wisconsin 54-1255) TaxID=500485 RepID=B6HUR5_PENRW|nr:hypothetical protein PCH_Pc22g27080 [Penicillium rubens Wisconsin 54-1255]